MLLGESMPSQLTTEYLSSKYGDTVVPLEINSPKKTLVKLGDYLQVKQLQHPRAAALHVLDDAGADGWGKTNPPVPSRDGIVPRIMLTCAP